VILAGTRIRHHSIGKGTGDRRDPVPGGVVRSGATEFRYERSRQPLPRIDPWRAQLDGLLLANEGKPARERLTLIGSSKSCALPVTRAATMRYGVTRRDGVSHAPLKKAKARLCGRTPSPGSRADRRSRTASGCGRAGHAQPSRAPSCR